jgi:hypothetical protein
LMAQPTVNLTQRAQAPADGEADITYSTFELDNARRMIGLLSAVAPPVLLHIDL